MPCSGCPKCEPPIDPVIKERPDFSKMTGEDIRVLALELEDAREDLNDALRKVAENFRRVELPPVLISMPHVGELIWNGLDLFFSTNREWTPLLSASLDARIAAAKHIEALYELGRKS